MTAGDVNTQFFSLLPKKAYYLNLNGGIVVPHDSELNFQQGLTFTAWFKPFNYNSETDFGRILDKADTTGGAQGYVISLQGGESPSEMNFNLSGAQMLQTTAVKFGGWNFAAIKVDPTGVCTQILNGEETTKAGFDVSNIQNTQPLGIGFHPAGNLRHFRGYLSDIRMFNRNLDNSEIKAIKEGKVINQGLVASYPLEKDATDLTGNHDGTVSGGIFIEDGFEGKRAAVFNGSNSYLQTTALSHPHQNTPSSMAFWIKANDTSTQQNIITQGHSTNDRMAIGLESNKMEMAWYNGSFTGVATIAYTSNNWNHIVYTYDGAGTGKCYLNGVLQSATTGNPSTSTSNFTLGASGAGSNPLNGCLADVQIWSRVLSADEALLVSQGNAVNQGLIHQYKFNRDVTDSVGGKDLTNVSSNVKISVVSQNIASVINQLYTSANDKKLLTNVGGQLLYVRVEEAA